MHAMARMSTSGAIEDDRSSMSDNVKFRGDVPWYNKGRVRERRQNLTHEHHESSHFLLDATIENGDATCGEERHRGLSPRLGPRQKRRV